MALLLRAALEKIAFVPFGMLGRQVALAGILGGDRTPPTTIGPGGS